jgi:deoxyribodipyrimidine photolyase
LSPYLHFGCVSPRELESQLADGDGEQAFRRQLCWRDFYAHVLLFNPGTARVEHQERYRRRCVIGVDYPAPIVDHAAARREALERYAAAATRTPTAARRRGS